MHTENYSSFKTEKACSDLLPVEALALINRWAKVKNRFYYEDVNALYQIKEEKISEWLANGEIVATTIITRESHALAGMKKAIANNGAELEWLDYDSFRDLETPEEDSYIRMLFDLTGSGCDEYQVPYPDDLYAKWLKALEPEIAQYKVACKEYEIERKRRQPIIQKYNEELNKYRKQKEQAAEVWAKENKVRIARTHSGKSRKKDWLNRLIKQGFKYDVHAPNNPFPKKLKLQPPPKVDYPDKTYPLTLETYLPGSIPEIEEIL